MKSRIAPACGLLAAGLLALPAASRAAPAQTVVCGELAADSVWTAAGGPYRTSCEVVVPAGRTLRIEAGAQVLLGAGHAIRVAGSLQALGSAEAPLRFEPAEAGQAWGSIQLEAGSGPSEIGHARFSGGGGPRRQEMLGIATDRALVHHSDFSDSAGIALEVKDGASPEIRDSRFIRSSQPSANPPAALRLRGASRARVENNAFLSNNPAGVYWDPEASPHFQGNRFEHNGYNGVIVYGTVKGDVTWPGLGPRRWAYHIIRAGVTVDPGATLRITPGATLRFAPGLGMRVLGALQVRGAATHPVRFSTGAPEAEPGQWREIAFEPESADWDAATETGSILEHAELEYGGGSNTGAILIRDSSPLLRYVTVRASGHRGATVIGPGARPRIVGGLFAHNAAADGTGLFVSGEAAPEVTMSIFRANQDGVRVEAGARPRLGPHNWFDYNRSEAVVNLDRTVCVDATGNDWGGPAGPIDPSESRDACDQGGNAGDGERVSDHVRYVPFEGRTLRPAITAPRCGVLSEDRPWIEGLAAPGARVLLYANEALLGETLAEASTGELAAFRFRPDAPLAPGSYVLQARSVLGEAESGIGNPVGIGVDPSLAIDPAGMTISHEPEGTRFVQPFQDESGCLALRGDAEWNIRPHPGAPLELAVPLRCAGGEAPEASILYGEATIPMAKAADGRHAGRFEMGLGGALRLQTRCGALERELLIGTVTPELNGFIYDRSGEPSRDRIAGARVSLFVFDRSRPPGQQWVFWNAAAHHGQVNPQVTGFSGWYAFYPPPGLYRVLAEAEGFETVIHSQTELTIEPVVETIGLLPLARPVLLPALLRLAPGWPAAAGR